MFNCVCVDDCEPAEFHTVVDRTARKEHTCGECRCKIGPGEQYEYVTMKYDGQFSVNKTCMTCVRIRTDLLPCGWYYGEIWSLIHDANCGHEEDDEFCLCPC